jgi:hypothetical protein
MLDGLNHYLLQIRMQGAEMLLRVRPEFRHLVSLHGFRVGAMDDDLVNFSHRSPLAHGVGYLDVQFVAQRIVGRHTGCCHVLSFPAAELETLKSEG